MGLLTVCVSSLEKCLYKSSPLEKWGVFSSNYKSPLYNLMRVPYQTYGLSVFSPILCDVFSLSRWYRLQHKTSYFDKFDLFLFF